MPVTRHFIAGILLATLVGFGHATVAVAQDASVPLIESSIVLEASDGAAYDALGTAVVLQDESLFVGCRGADAIATNAGAIYLFEPDAVTGDWTQVQKLTSSDSLAFDETGSSLAIDGVRLAAGAPRADLPGVEDAGRVVLFTFNGASWVESATIEAPSPEVDAAFGRVIALSGTTLAVGAPLHDHVGGVRDEGEVHLYTFDDDSVSWSLAATIQAPDAGENDQFGSSVVLAGDLLAVGAAGDDDAGINAGAVWVFRQVDGSWVPETKLTGDAGEWFAGFGCDLALDETATGLAVGVDRSDAAGTDDGAVMVFRDQGDGTWNREATLVAPFSPDARAFGTSLDFDGARLAVGMPVYDQPLEDAGAVATFVRGTDGSWSAELLLQAAGAQLLELCGTAVAADAGRLVAGRPLAGGSNDWRGGVVLLDLTVDCNEDGTPDLVEIAAGTGADCNDNGLLDACDIEDGTVEDVDGNGIPDVCFFDCDENGVNDEDEIADGSGDDLNQNGVLDDCECIADLSGDGVIGGPDLSLLLGSWGTPPPSLPQADINGDGVVSGPDLAYLLSGWATASSSKVDCTPSALRELSHKADALFYRTKCLIGRATALKLKCLHHGHRGPGSSS